MKRLSILLFLFISSHIVLSQSISTDASGKSVVLGGAGGSGGLDFQRAMFNVNYCFISPSLVQETKPLLGFSYTGSNRSGMTDFLKNGTTSISSNLRVHIGFTTSNAIGKRFTDPTGYKNQLTNRLNELDSLMKPIKADSSYIIKAKQTFPAIYGDFANEIIKAYRMYYPDPQAIKTEIWRAFKQSKHKENLTLYYQIKEYIKNQVNEPLKKLKYYEEEKQLIKEQLSGSVSLPLNYSEFTVFFSGGLNSMGFNSINRLPNNNTLTQAINKNHFVGMLGVNHRFGKNWYLGYGLGFEVQDNFEALERVSIDSVVNTQGGMKSVKNTIYGFSGNYTTVYSNPFLLQLSFLTNHNDIGTIIYTPIYLSLGKRTQYGTSASLVLKNNTSFGINVEELVLSDALTQKGAKRYLSFGFNVKYVLNDFKIK